MAVKRFDMNIIKKKNTDNILNHEIKNGNNIIPYFDDIEIHLLKYINESTYIIGCVAWLTNENIIDAIIKKEGCKLIVNKEEYLSSKLHHRNNRYCCNLRNKYDNIKDLCEIKIDKSNPIYNNLIEPLINTNKKGAILTCGIVNNKCKLHHKFIIFYDKSLNPIGVWTGSYNLSVNSNYSLENVIFIKDEYVINEYLKEFIMISKKSEPYNWVNGSIDLE